MTDDILTNDAIRKLTGYKQPKKQCAWLASAGIWFKEDRNGYPRTTEPCEQSDRIEDGT